MGLRISLSIFPILSLVPGVLGEAPNKNAIIPEGSTTAGKTLFVEKSCYQCHIVEDISMPGSDLGEDLLIDLGIANHAGWSRDDYARAVMDPNHTVSEEYRKIMMSLGDNLKAENSPMPGFNDLLTVSDLIHLTTFLESLLE